METKKTGATPIPEGDLAGGKILGAMRVKWRGIVHYRDGMGKVDTKMISVLENGDVYFEENVKYVPSQSWFKKIIHEKIGHE